MLSDSFKGEHHTEASIHFQMQLTSRTDKCMHVLPPIMILRIALPQNVGCAC